MNKIHILCYNIGGTGFRAKAFWSHKPTVEDILKLDGFDERTELDELAAKFIIIRSRCRIVCEEAFAWTEYILITGEEGKDLNLGDYLLTGYCDFMDSGETIIVP